MRWLDNITNSMDMNLSNLQEIVEDRGAWSATVHGVRRDLVTEKQKQQETQAFKRRHFLLKTSPALVCLVLGLATDNGKSKILTRE